MSQLDSSASPYVPPAASAASGMPGQPAFGPASPAGDHTGGIIPYKNPKALIAYYAGVFSLIPLLGSPLALVAIVLGILGLRDSRRNPVIRGTAHAWVGIVLGTLVCVGYVTLIGLLVFANQ